MTEADLSNDFIVACELYHLTEVKKERVWFTKLVKSIQEKQIGKRYLTKHDISHALDTLTDWGIVEGEYGPTEKGGCGYLYYIDMERHEDRIKKVYEEHYGK